MRAKVSSVPTLLVLRSTLATLDKLSEDLLLPRAIFCSDAERGGGRDESFITSGEITSGGLGGALCGWDLLLLLLLFLLKSFMIFEKERLWAKWHRHTPLVVVFAPYRRIVAG